MLAALAALMVLAAAMLTVVSLVARDARTLREHASVVALPQQIALEQLKRDVVNARFFQQDPAGRWVVLVGYGSLDGQTFSCDGRAAQVVYSIRRTGKDVSALFRRQRPLDDDHTAEGWEELVAVGATGIDVREELGPAEDLGAASATQGWKLVPDRVRVTFKSAVAGSMEKVVFVVR